MAQTLKATRGFLTIVHDETRCVFPSLSMPTLLQGLFQRLSCFSKVYCTMSYRTCTNIQEQEFKHTSHWLDIQIRKTTKDNGETNYTSKIEHSVVLLHPLWFIVFPLLSKKVTTNIQPNKLNSTFPALAAVQHTSCLYVGLPYY